MVASWDNTFDKRVEFRTLIDGVLVLGKEEVRRIDCFDGIQTGEAFDNQAVFTLTSFRCFFRMPGDERLHDQAHPDDNGDCTQGDDRQRA